MSEERRRILDMLSQGKISAQEAEQLLDALGAAGRESSSGGAKPPKYLRVLIEDQNSQNGGKVNVRIPLSLVRAGVKLAALLPQGAYDQVNRAFKEKGVGFDVTQLRPENIEELIQNLNDLSVDVEGGKGEKVRVFCE